jgi:hypothetical protein
VNEDEKDPMAMRKQEPVDALIRAGGGPSGR